MQSKFCKWLTDLSVIAEKENVIVEAKYYDALEYLFNAGLTPELAFPRYKSTSARMKAINEEPASVLTTWRKTSNELPPQGVEVLGFNEHWVDEDVNPDGICVCYQANDGAWYVAKFCNYHDEWHTRLCGEESERYETILDPPTYWASKPVSPSTKPQ